MITKFNKRIVMTSMLIVVALFVIASVYCVTNDKSVNDYTQVVNEQEIPEESMNNSIPATEDELLDYESKIYNFSFEFSSIAVSWNAKSNVENKRIFIATEKSNFKEWKILPLVLSKDSRGTIYSSKSLNISGNELKYKISFNGENEFIQDLSIIVANNDQIDDIYMEKVKYVN